MLMEIAKRSVGFVALYAFGGFIADAIVPSTSRQHLWNFAWSPRAKFHNGQTMLMGIFGGSLSLYILFSSQPLTSQVFYLALTTAAQYWVTTVLAPLFPGTAWYDPEFKDASWQPFGFSPQKILSYGLCRLLVVAAVLATLS